MRSKVIFKQKRLLEVGALSEVVELSNHYGAFAKLTTTMKANRKSRPHAKEGEESDRSRGIKEEKQTR